MSVELHLYDEELQIVQNGHVMVEYEVKAGVTEEEVRVMLYERHGVVVSQAQLLDLR